MTREPERDELAPEDEPTLSGEDRYEMDVEARDATHDLTPAEQEALFTQMRRHIEMGASDQDAWRRAYEDVRNRSVPLAREGEEGSRRDEHPVEARKETPYPEPESVDED